MIRLKKKLLILSVCLFTFFGPSMQTNYRVIDYETFESNEKYIILDEISTIDGYLFTIKGRSARVVESVLVTVKAYRKKANGEFKEFFKNLPIIDWCAVMKSASKNSPNIFAKFAVLFCRKALPDLVKPCPYKKDLTIMLINSTVEYKLMSFFPSGIYKTRVLLNHKNGDNMLNISFIGEIF